MGGTASHRIIFTTIITTRHYPKKWYKREWKGKWVQQQLWLDDSQR